MYNKTMSTLSGRTGIKGMRWEVSSDFIHDATTVACRYLDRHGVSWYFGFDISNEQVRDVPFNSLFVLEYVWRSFREGLDRRYEGSAVFWPSLVPGRWREHDHF